jgi:hypothetical protein
MSTKKKDDLMNEDNEVRTSWMKFNKIGDYIQGTLVSVREIQSTLPGKENEMVKVYEVKAQRGEFHDTDEKKQIVEPAISINADEVWNVGGGIVIDSQMRNIKLGQIIAIKFTEEKPAQKKGFNPMKVKKVYSKGEMDEEWLKQKEEEAALNDF